MEQFTISKSEKQTIYEIYRACRLCGAGGGYRMPIIQHIVDLESSDVELRQKIQECLQLEVCQNDRMPPLICELCVDKVNDFYAFFNLTRQTNVRTRTRLGLPLQTAKKGEPEQSDCILGVTEPVYVKDDEPPAKKSKAGPKCSKKIEKEPDVVKVMTATVSDSSRSSSVSSRSSRARAPTPPPLTPTPTLTRRSKPPAKPPAKPAPPAPAATPAPAHKPAPPPKPAPTKPAAHKSKGGKDTPKTAQQTPKEKDKKTPKERKSEIQYLLEDNIMFDDTSLLTPRATKRTREEPPKPAPPPKRTKAPPPKEPEREPSPPRSRPGPKSKKKPEPKAAEPPKDKKQGEDKNPVAQKQDKVKSKAKPESAKAKETPKPPEDVTPKSYKCCVCDAQLKTVQAYSSHVKWHTPTFTKLTHACNPCEKWFATAEEAATHHRYHRAATFPYHCRRCFGDYKTLQLYNDHISQGSCTPLLEQPDVKCPQCWSTFATETLMKAHKCGGEDARPGGKCPKCNRTYATAKTLSRHECKPKRKRDLIADPDVLRRLKPMQVRIRRCDGLFAREVGDHYDVSAVKPTYGLAKNYVYPYLKFSQVKTEPLHRDSMVAIPVALEEEFATDYTHWDSDEDDDTVLRRVPSLTTLAIKKLFSKHCLGKVPRRRKRVKNEVFEDNDFGKIGNINDLISNLHDASNGNLDKKEITDRIKDIIGCLGGGENIDVEDRSRNMVDDDSKDVTEGSKDEDVTEGSKVENVAAKGSEDENVIESSKVENITEGSKDQNIIDSSKVEDFTEDVTICNGDVNWSDNVNESTKGLIESNELNECEETSSVEIGNVENNDNVVTNNDSNHINEESGDFNRSQSETVIDKDLESENNQDFPIDDNKETETSLQTSTENQMEIETEPKELENISLNGIAESKSNCEERKSEELSKPVNKESPIKHSIENLIGETDMNPDKYISEVISSIEDIINKNPRQEDDRSHEHDQLNGQTDMNNSNAMDVLDNIENKISDSDKITLEDLLPKEDRQMELDNISDEDFNFDA